MKILKAYDIRVYPSNANESLIKKTLGCTRFVPNKMLYSINTTGKRPTEAELKKIFPFLKEVDSIALQQSRINLQIAFKNFKERKTGYPKFKSKKSNKQSYRTVPTNNNIKVDFETLEIKLPKLAPMKFRDDRIFTGKIKNVTVKKTPTNKYFAAVLVEEEIEVTPVILADSSKTIGLDMGCTHFMTDSNGKVTEAPKYFKKYQKKLRKAQQKLSRKLKGSKCKEKQRLKVARIHERIASKRKDFLHKSSSQITNEYDGICVESLNMAAMSQSLHLAKSVYDNAWSGYDKQLEYKSLWKGKTFLRTEKLFPSSKRCSYCGHKNKFLKLNDLVWTCPICRTCHDRNHNAAKNLEDNLRNTLGIREIHACGDDVGLKLCSCRAMQSSLKQEAHGFIRG